MGKQLVPEENFLYTFVMPKTGLHNIYEFHGESDRGRYVMYNVEKGCVVNFSKAWFSFLATKCLLKKEKKKDVVQEQASRIEIEQIERLKREKEEQENRAERDKQDIRCLRSFTENEKTRARELLGVSIEDFIEKLAEGWDAEKALLMDNICKLFPDKPWAI